MTDNFDTFETVSWVDAETPEEAARSWFGVPVGPLSEKQRQIGKNIQLGKTYQMGSKAFTRALNNWKGGR